MPQYLVICTCPTDLPCEVTPEEHFDSKYPYQQIRTCDAQLPPILSRAIVSTLGLSNSYNKAYFLYSTQILTQYEPGLEVFQAGQGTLGAKVHGWKHSLKTC